MERQLLMVITIHDTSIASTGKEDRRTSYQITNPTCILEYNKYMKGVDGSNPISGKLQYPPENLKMGF